MADPISETRIDAGSGGFVSKQFEVPAEGWQERKYPVVPVSPAEWAALDWEWLNVTPDPEAHGQMLVHRYVKALRRQVSASADHVLAAELALACPLVGQDHRLLFEGSAESHSRLALAAAMVEQGRGRVGGSAAGVA